MEVHHIVEVADGGNDDASNAIPLCFDCHADMRSYDHKHPKGNKLGRTELERHRDNWFKKVSGNIGILTREETKVTDTQVYSCLVKILPWDGSVRFIRTNNFNGFHFRLEQLEQFNEFEHESQNPAFEFLDPDLEGLRVKLVESVDSFMLTVSTDTFSTGDEWRAVPDDWNTSNPKRFKAAVDDLHKYAREITQTYDSLVKTATRKLGVLPGTMAADT